MSSSSSSESSSPSASGASVRGTNAAMDREVGANPASAEGICEGWSPPERGARDDGITF